MHVGVYVCTCPCLASREVLQSRGRRALGSVPRRVESCPVAQSRKAKCFLCTVIKKPELFRLPSLGEGALGASCQHCRGWLLTTVSEMHQGSK